MRHMLIAMLMAAAVSAVQAQEIPKRARVVGEWCEYEVEGAKKLRARREVIAVAPDGGYTIKASGDVPEEIRVFNADHRLVSRAGRAYIPAYGGPLYPLKVGGREGGGSFTYPHPSQSGVTVAATAEIKPIVAERITVPAGTFDTLKVEMVANYKVSTSASAQFKETAWYARDPTLNFAVRSEFVDFGAGGTSYAVLLLRGWGSPKQTPSVSTPAKATEPKK